MAESSTTEEIPTQPNHKLGILGWTVGDKVRYLGPVVDAREFGAVTKIEKSPPHGTVKWDTDKVGTYYFGEEGLLFDAGCAGKPGNNDKWVRGERMEVKPVGSTSRKRDRPKDVDIVRTGSQILLPTGMSYDEGIVWLTRKKEADEKEIAIMEVVDAIPLEGAYAFKRALDRKYGFTAMSNTPGSFFQPEQPPTMIGVEIEMGKTEQVPWGRLSVPGIAGYFETQLTQKDGQFRFQIGGVTKQKHKGKVQELAELTRQIALEESIYKGKAIRVKFPTEEQIAEEQVGPLDNQPKFIDTAGIREEDLIFPDAVAALVRTAIFVPIEKRVRCRAEGVPFKRGVILEGPWGVGKTLTANVTAQKCVANGITYIYLDRVEDLEQALRFAVQYQPAVVFAEDIDQVARDSRHDKESPLNAILNTIDGVELKNADIMVILTTNYIGEVEQALLRPGRVDAVIPVRPPDAPAVQRLVRLYSRGRLSEHEDLRSVGVKLEGQIPAVIREVVERAKLEAIGRVEEGETLCLTAHDLELASDSMLAHLDLLKPRIKDERTPYEKAAAILAEAITRPRALAPTVSEDLSARRHVAAALAAASNN